MRGECCRAYIWPHGIFFSSEVVPWESVTRNAKEVTEIKYMSGWRPWNTIYRVVTIWGKEETYAIYQNVSNRNYRSWYWKNREQGLCVRCSRPTGSTGCMCNACKVKTKAANIRRQNGREQKK